MKKSVLPSLVVLGACAANPPQAVYVERSGLERVWIEALGME